MRDWQGNALFKNNIQRQHYINLHQKKKII